MELRLILARQCPGESSPPDSFFPELLISLPLSTSLSPPSLGSSVLDGNKPPRVLHHHHSSQQRHLSSKIGDRPHSLPPGRAGLGQVAFSSLHHPQPPATTVNPPDMNAKPPRCGLCTCLDLLPFSSALHMTNPRLQKKTQTSSADSFQKGFLDLEFRRDAPIQVGGGKQWRCCPAHKTNLDTKHTPLVAKQPSNPAVYTCPFPSNALGIYCHAVLPDSTPTTPQHILTAVRS